VHHRFRRQPRVTERVKGRRERGHVPVLSLRNVPLVSNSVGSAGRCVEKGKGEGGRGRVRVKGKDKDTHTGPKGKGLL